MKRRYVVVSGPMEWIEPVVEYLPGIWDGPVEGFRVDVNVWARNKRDAIAAAVRHWQRRCTRPRNQWGRNPCCYPHRQREDGLNPFAGIKAYEVEALEPQETRQERI